MSEHHPEETMPVVASDLDCADLPDELIDELLAGARTPEEITGPEGLLQRLTKRLVERAMAAELSEQLGYERGQAPPGGAGNARNGMTPKTVHTEHGSVRLEQPRDRRGSFEPQIVPKHQRRFDGFDGRIVAMYARGMSVRDIQAHLAELTPNTKPGVRGFTSRRRQRPATRARTSCRRRRWRSCNGSGSRRGRWRSTAASRPRRQRRRSHRSHPSAPSSPGAPHPARNGRGGDSRATASAPRARSRTPNAATDSGAAA